MNPLRFFRNLHEDEGAVGLAFGALTLFIAVALVAMSVDVWELLRAKVQAQDAADAVAYSAAAMTANTLAVLSSLNMTLIWIYRTALGIIAAVITTGVLAALNVLLPGAFAWAVPLFERSLAIAQDWLPRLVAWARAVGRLQDGIVKGTPAAIEAEALRIARANGASVGFVLPVVRLPVEREKNIDRFLDRVGGGVVPAWGLKYLFPGEPAASERGGLFRKAGSQVVRRHRKGRSFDETRHQSAGEEDIGVGAQNPRTAGMLARFRQILADIRRKPLPLSLVLTDAYARMRIQSVAWSGADPVRERILLGETFFPWPAAAKGFLTLAATQPRHPRIDANTVQIDPDNLYRTDGWEVAWRSVDLAALRRSSRTGAAGKFLSRLKGVSAVEGLIHH